MDDAGSALASCGDFSEDSSLSGGGAADSCSAVFSRSGYAAPALVDSRGGETDVAACQCEIRLVDAGAAGPGQHPGMLPVRPRLRFARRLVPADESPGKWLPK